LKEVRGKVARIRNNFKILKARKEQELGRNITYEEISEATGISPNTLSSYATGSIGRYDESTVTRLCDYFGVTLPELLEYPPVTRQESHAAYLTAV
jgi:transcriptional regulator with XRE-family HTH domain